MTKYPEFWAMLAARFAKDEVKTIEGKRDRDGNAIKFVSARTVMNRLDEVVGPENWWDEYSETEKGVKCRLTIRTPDDEQITKEDGGGFAKMTDGDDTEKSAYSSAFKRAAVKFGIGRYLYRDGMPPFVRIALGMTSEQQPQERSQDAGHEVPPEGLPQTCPKDGRAFYGWLTEYERANKVKVMDEISTWARNQQPRFPFRVMDWNGDQVRSCWEAFSFPK